MNKEIVMAPIVAVVMVVTLTIIVVVVVAMDMVGVVIFTTYLKEIWAIQIRSNAQIMFMKIFLGILKILVIDAVPKGIGLKTVELQNIYVNCIKHL